jgi:hypothetical protein
VANHVEDRRAVHHDGFEPELDACAPGFVCERRVGMGDGTFIRGNRVHAAGECSADVRDGGFAGGWIERGELDDDFGFGSIEEFVDGFDALSEYRFNREAVRIERGPVAQGLDRHDAKRKNLSLFFEQMRERAADTSVSEQCEPQKSIFSMSEVRSDSSVVRVLRNWLC